MAVDRGGLDYRIQVNDQFSAAIEAFRAQIRGAQAEYAKFAATTAKANAGVTSSRKRAKELSVEEAAQRKLNAELRKAAIVRAQATLAEQQGIVTEKQAALNEKTRVGTLSTLTRLKTQFAAAEAKATAAANQAAVAQKRAAAAEERRAAAIRKVGEAQRSAFSKFAQQTAVTNANTIATGDMVAAQSQYAKTTNTVRDRLRSMVAAQRESVKAAGAQNGVFQNLFFTFRRLIGVFAAFLVLRQVVGVITSSIGEAIRFNAALESASLGIAAVINATGNVSDAMGGAATSAERFAIATRAADDQVKKLRKDALSTNATFEQLLETFQIAIGPGLAAGLDLDEIRALTVQISQAAAAIGLPQNQLAEEVRSILSGTIQLRTTRLAAVLGITNEDIKSARELGTLVEFLDQKFKAFGVSGEASLKTFNVLLSNTGDALRQAFAEGGIGFFDEVKLALNDVLTTVASVSKETQSVEINPRLLVVIRTFLSGLEAATAIARELFTELSADDFFQSAQATASAVTGIAKGLSIAIKGFVKGLNAAAGIFNTILAVASAIGGALGLNSTGGFFSGLLGVAAQLLVTFGAIRVAMLAIGKLVVFTFQVSLGKGLVSALALLKGVRSIRDVLLVIQLAFASNPIGLALTAIAATVGVVLSRLGVFDSLLGSIDDKTEAVATSTADLIKQFKSLQGQISGAVDNSGKFAENIKDLTEDLRKAQAQSQFEVLSAGLSGGVRQQAQLFADAQVDFQERSLEITRNLQTANSDLLGTQRQRVAAEREIADLSTTQRAQVEIVTAALTKQFQVSQQQAKIEAELATKKLALQKAQAEGLPTAALQIEVSGLESQQTALKGAEKDAEAGVARIADLQHQLITTGQLTQEQSDQLFESVQRRIELQGQEVSLGAQVNDLTAQQLELSTLIAGIRDAKLRAAAAEEVQRLNEENLELEVQIRQLERIRGARQGLFDAETQATQVAEAANALDAEQVKLGALKTQQALDLSNAQANAEAATDPTTKAFLEAQVLAIQRNQNNELAIQNELIAEANRKLELQKAIAERPIELGFTKALETFAADATNQFQFAVDLMTEALNGLATLISTSIVDAFDPTKKVDLKERFARFLQDIAGLILNHLAKLAVAKAALSVFGDTAGGTGIAVSAALGFAEGGVTPNAPAGAVAPPGVARSDKVHAMLTPGEPVTPVASARMYGYDFFEALRSGALDVSSVRALMDSNHLSGLRSAGSRGMGFAIGGVADVVPGTAGAQSSAGDGMGVGIIAPTERTQARIAAGGRRARQKALVQDRALIRQLAR